MIPSGKPRTVLSVRTLSIMMLILAAAGAPGQSPDSTVTPVYRHSLDLCPLSPVLRIWAFHYCYRFSDRDELVVGPLYMNITYEDIGHTDAPGLIIGYRHYFWKGLHADYQLMPGWDRFYDEVEKKRYRGFDLWNEFRLGYVWDFSIGSLPAFVHVQWPFGFALYSDPDGKPESFKKRQRENPLFYFPPLFFVGIRL